MKSLIDWQDDADNAAPEERATVADLQLFISDMNVTQHLLGTVADDKITISAIPSFYELTTIV